jgi:hypothetical protein
MDDLDPNPYDCTYNPEDGWQPDFVMLDGKVIRNA